MTSVGSLHHKPRTSGHTRKTATAGLTTTTTTTTTPSHAAADFATTVVQLLTKATRDRHLVSIAVLLLGFSLAICLIIRYMRVTRDTT